MRWLERGAPHELVWSFGRLDFEWRSWVLDREWGSGSRYLRGLWFMSLWSPGRRSSGGAREAEAPCSPHSLTIAFGGTTQAEQARFSVHLEGCKVCIRIH